LKTAKVNTRPTVYQYNVDTCAYEPHKRSFFGYIAYGFFLVLTAGLFFVGLLFVHDYVVESEHERKLETENALLKKYTGILTSDLKEVEQTLGELEEKDKRLHKKFFTTELESSPAKTDAHAIILTGNTSDFRKQLRALESQSENVSRNAKDNDVVYAENLSLDQSKINELINLPVIPPVENLDPSTILSGYGMRINPFHKAVHHHPGIDIALPRGTNIIATASGIVKTVKRSDLQAGYGNFIEIDHGNNVITRYAHLETVAVRVGQKIDKGATIASSGNSGGSVAPHLHYEIIRNNANVDPVYYFISNVSPEDYSVIHTVSRSENQSLD